MQHDAQTTFKNYRAILDDFRSKMLPISDEDFRDTFDRIAVTFDDFERLFPSPAAQEQEIESVQMRADYYLDIGKQRRKSFAKLQRLFGIEVEPDLSDLENEDPFDQIRFPKPR